MTLTILMYDTRPFAAFADSHAVVRTPATRPASHHNFVFATFEVTA